MQPLTAPKVYIDAWKFILRLCKIPWVLFSQGTIVMLPMQTKDARQQAKQFLKNHGPVLIATEQADFTIGSIQGYQGWIIYSYMDQMATYVAPFESSQGIAAGLFGRSKRDKDSKSLNIIHVQQAKNE